MSDGLDQGRLARALHAAEPVRYAECYHGLSMSDCGIDAEDIAREYARLAAEPKRSPETPGLREAIEALPRLRITGEQLDAIDPDPEKVFYTDWDEWDEYVRLDAVRAALAAPSPETPGPAGDEWDETVTIREKDLRDAWMRLDAVGDPRTAHTLWQHLTLGVVAEPIGYVAPSPETPLPDQPPVPGGTTAIRGGQYVTEERAPGPPSPETPGLREAARDVIVVFRSTPASLARRHAVALDALERALVAEVP